MSPRETILALAVGALCIPVVEAQVGTSFPQVPSVQENVRSYGAIGNGIADDTAAIKAAIAAAKATGTAGLRAGIVLFPPGEYAISSPLILPRTGPTAVNVVQLVGSGPRTTRLKGMASFPTNRAMVEWDPAVTTQAWHQSIRDLGFVLPDVAGTMAIDYKPNDKRTAAGCLRESISITLTNLLIEGSNQYHRRLIYLEGNVKVATFRDINGDPAVGTPAYDTVLLEFDTTDFGVEGSDSAGCIFCTFDSITPMIRRGGYSVALKGRLLRSSLTDVHAQQARSAATLELDNSNSVIVADYANEGGGSQPQVKISNSSDLQFTSLGIGSPVDKGLGVGNGMELVNVRDSTFTGLWRRTGVGAFNTVGKKLLTIDSACKRLRFNAWVINAALGSEVANRAADANDVTGSFYDIQNSVQYYLGRHLKRTTPTYGASVGINASLGDLFDVTVTNGTAFTVANPTNPTDGQRITITIRNTSGGALGTVTWDTLYKLAAWTSPATAFSRSIDFMFDGTNWVEIARTAADVPN